MIKSVAEILFEAQRTYATLVTNLDDIGIDYEDISYDYYDGSIELKDVPDEFKLSPEQQEFIFNAGFKKCYVNHKSGTETHYSWYHLTPETFVPVVGVKHKEN